MHCARVVAAVAFAATSLEAAQFRVTSEGKEIIEAEICLFKAGRAATPITRYFQSAEVSCKSADKDVPIPAGEWNVFARKGTELVSDRVELIADRTRPAEIGLTPAARLTTSRWRLADDERIFVYVPRTGSAMPLQAAVPAGVVVPLVVREGRIVRIGAPVELAEGETRDADPPATSTRADVIVPIAFKALPEGSRGAPEIALVDSAGQPHRNIAPMTRLEPGAAGLAIFRGVTPGAATVTLSGSRWATVEAKVDATPQVTASNEILIARPASRLIVHWWSPVDLATLRPSVSECKAEADVLGRVATSDSQTFTARLFVCPDEPNPIPARCKRGDPVEIATGDLRGQVEFSDVPVGTHFVMLAYPSLPTIVKRVEVVNAAEATADIELRYFSFFGKVTRGEEPVHARVFGAVTDPATGSYVAVMSQRPARPVPYSVTFCDGSGRYRFVPDEPPVENAEFNIEVPENRIVVEVADKTTGLPIEDALVHLAAIMPDGPPGAAHYAGPAGKTGNDGRLVIEPVLRNRELHICASHADYNRSCADDFVMKDREKSIRLALEKALKRRGRITTGKPQNGQLIWFSRDGKITEMIREFTDSGEFTYRVPHAEGEIVVLLSADGPLFAFHHPRLLDDQPLEITYPSVPRRSVTVTLSADSREEVAFVALQIGDITVPIDGVGWHLMARRTQSSLRPSWTVTIPDVLETGPISVILVPGSFMQQFESRQVMMPLLPEAATLPRQRLGDDGSVTFHRRSSVGAWCRRGPDRTSAALARQTSCRELRD